LSDYIYLNLNPFYKAKELGLTGAIGGLVFQLIENGGLLEKRQISPQLRVLVKRDYGILHHLGIKIGRREVFFPKLLKPKTAGLCALLWAIKNGVYPIPKLPAPGRVSVVYDSFIPSEFMQAAGYRRAGHLLVRVDILERAIGVLNLRATKDFFEAGPDLLNLLGCSREDIIGVLKSLGYEKQEGLSEKGGVILFAKEKRKYEYGLKNKGANNLKFKRRRKSQPKILLDDSPFAKLKEIFIH
jgi:ATP-dependent RNA helicase SUPV3L1/SUV3